MEHQTGEKNPIRVILWSYKGSGLHYGGPGMSAYRLYSKAEAGRFRLELVHGWPEQAQTPLFEEQHLISPLSNLGPRPQWRFIRKGIRWLKASARRFDVFHGLQGFHLTIRPAFEAERLGLPAVIKLGAYRTDLADKPGWRAWLNLPRRRRRLAIQLSGMIAISEAIAQELLGYGFPESKIARIPDGVDTDQFHPATADERRSLRCQLNLKELPTFLFVGGIAPRKNPMVMVEAIGLLKRHGIECQLVIVGPDHDPAYTMAVKERANDLGVRDLVVWFGFTADIAPLYRIADVYGLPSSQEGLPNALLEAMASGLPSIVTPISGSTDVVSDGKTGMLMVAEAGPIAESLSTYVTDPTLARLHGSAARQLMEQRYSVVAVLAAHERLFRRVMSGGSAAE